MRKLFIFLIIASVSFVLIGCGSKVTNKTTNSVTSATNTSRTTKNVTSNINTSKATQTTRRITIVTTTTNKNIVSTVETTKEEIIEVKNVMPRKSIKILSIGNSASDDILAHVYSILNSYGVQEIVVANMYLDSADINKHVNAIATDSPTYIYKKNANGKWANSTGMKMSSVLKNEDWDIITFQQDISKSGDLSEYDKKINALIEYIENAIQNDKTKFAWNMIWSYAKTYSGSSFEKYEKDPVKMYQAIVECVNKKILTNKNIDFILPVGTAIQNARTSYLKETLFRDGSNLEELGQFIAGLTFVVGLTNWEINDLNYNLIPQRYIPYLDVINESVDNAINKPYEIIESNCLVDPIKSMPSSPFTTTNNIQYSDVSSMCKLDMYLPNSDSFDVIVHFHGGGITGGSKDDGAHVMMARSIAGGGVGFVSANYRLYPAASYPDFFVDAANAIKYVYDYMKENNISGKLYVSGQSAGAYIAMMLCLNKQYLEDVGMSVMDVDGWLIDAGQPTTHFQVLVEDGLDSQLQRIDEKAPMYYVTSATKFKKLLLITYTNDMACRLAQTTLLRDAIKNYNPNAKVELRIYEGNHCVNSTTAYRNFIIHAKILLDYVNNNK